MDDPLLFVSHVSEDHAAAMQLVGELERRGIRCWIAPRDVRPGQPFDDEIEAAIERTRAMLLVFSDRCNDSTYIRREITVAGEAQKLVIPLRIEDAQPKKGLKIRLSDLHWIDAFAAREEAIDAVVRTMNAAGNDQRPAPRPNPQAAPAQQPPPQSAAKPPPQSVPPSPVARPDLSGDLDGLRRRAEAGEAQAQYMLGFRYVHGVGAPMATALGREWYRKAAEQGHAEAQASLGYACEAGIGGPVDLAEAASWYRKACDQGDRQGTWLLGALYEKGRGVTMDIAEAARLYRSVADLGYPFAQMSLGRLYEQGLGVPTNLDEAAKLYASAAAKGIPAAAEGLKRLGLTP